jgi:hypothetical protein
MSQPIQILRTSDPLSSEVLRRVRVSADAGYTTLCSEELTARIARDISRGASPRSAAQAHGISLDVFKMWMTKGLAATQAEVPEPNSPYANFYLSILMADAGARVTAEQRVLDTYPEKWLALRIAEEAREGSMFTQVQEETPQERVISEFSQPDKIAELAAVFSEMHKSMVTTGPHPLQGHIVDADDSSAIADVFIEDEESVSQTGS